MGATFAIPGQLFHFRAQPFQLSGACLGGSQGVQTLSRPPIEPFIAVAGLAGDLLQQCGVVDPLRCGQPHIRVQVVRGDFSQCCFRFDTVQRGQPQFRFDSLLEQIIDQLTIEAGAQQFEPVSE